VNCRAPAHRESCCCSPLLFEPWQARPPPEVRGTVFGQSGCSAYQRDRAESTHRRSRQHRSFSRIMMVGPAFCCSGICASARYGLRLPEYRNARDIGDSLVFDTGFLFSTIRPPWQVQAGTGHGRAAQPSVPTGQAAPRVCATPVDPRIGASATGTRRSFNNGMRPDRGIRVSLGDDQLRVGLVRHRGSQEQRHGRHPPAQRVSHPAKRNRPGRGRGAFRRQAQCFRWRPDHLSRCRRISSVSWVAMGRW